MRFARYCVCTFVVVIALLADRSDLFAQAVGSSSPGSPIVDGTPTIDSITITEVLSIVDTEVGIDITHAFRGDLQIDITSPGSTTVRLSNNDGGGADDIIVTFSSTGVPFDLTQLSAGLAFEMQASGPGSLSDFAGEETFGDWVLEINDNAGVDDGTLNAWQLQLYDAGSGVVTTPVTAVQCSPPQSTQATLSWINPIPYDFIDILLDGVVVQTLGGTETTATVVALDEWTSYEICVAGTIAGETPLPICCAIATPGDTTGRHVVFAGETAPGLDSVAALRDALSVPTVELPSLDLVNGLPDSLWCCLGTFPSNRELSASDGGILKSLILAGIPVFVSGADVWGFDDPTAFNDVDGIHANIEDGLDSHFAMIGEDFLTGFDASYTDESVTSDFTDELIVAQVGEDELGDDARVILRDDTDPFNTAVAYYANSGGRVVCCSIEFAGYGGDQPALAEALLTFLTEVIFRRGDSNVDGTFDISDAVFTLSSLFIVGAPSSTCDDAADANDDGAVDISDAVYSLSALFTAGSPPPPPPGAADCSSDPSDDSLDCLEYDVCF